MTAAARYIVAVRALCEFTAKQGDLDLRFSPSPSAQEGIAGHAVVASRRGDNYRSEVTLEGDWGPLHVRGRADGYDPDRNLLEEVKTYRGQFTAIPGNHRHLAWAQLRVYGHLLCVQLGLQEVNLALVPAATPAPAEQPRADPAPTAPEPVPQPRAGTSAPAQVPVTAPAPQQIECTASDGSRIRVAGSGCPAGWAVAR